MKKLSIRVKIVLWFALALLVIAGFTAAAVLMIGGSVIKKGIRDDLVAMVEDNVDEVEYYSDFTDIYLDDDEDQYLEYGGGYIEIDDDFLSRVNGIYTSLYDAGGNMLCGENPLGEANIRAPFKNLEIQTVELEGVDYYIYDRELTQDGLEGFRLRGVVSSEHGASQTTAISRISLLLLPILVAAAVFGGYLIAGRVLRPIKQIDDAVENIQAGRDLARRIRLGGGDDELHRLAASFNDMFDRLEKLFLSERRLTSDVSHELRTPVSVILSQCEYTLEKPREPEEYTEALELIERQSKKMSRMIADMISFARLEQNAHQIELAELDLSELASSVSGDMKLIAEKNITLTAEISPGICVLGNRELLSRLLINLITNAYSYGKENGSILVRLRELPDSVELSVTDDGIGISQESIDKIWNRFYQGDPSRGSRGSGLGLSFVKEIAALHGGSVTVQSEPGRGSAFTFTMPKKI